MTYLFFSSLIIFVLKRESKKTTMKTLRQLGLIALGAMLVTSCAPHLKTNGNNGLPPGQVKKVTGAKSAKHYAPGQTKKMHKKHKNHY